MGRYLTFKRASHSECNGWPNHLTANDYGTRIDLTLKYNGGEDDYAEYEDELQRLYAFEFKDNGSWTAMIED